MRPCPIPGTIHKPEDTGMRHMQCLSYSLAWEPITWGPWLQNRISTQTRGCLNVTEVGRSSRRNMYDVITGTLENNSEEGWLWSCLLKQWREHVRVNVPIRGRLIPISEIHESSTPLKACQSVVWLMQRMTVSS